jgi:hypothetical protein
MTARREVLVLVAMVLAVDAAFIAVYFMARVEGASDSAKLAFTVVWTVVTLLVVLRGWIRVRSARLPRAGTRGG